MHAHTKDDKEQMVNHPHLDVQRNDQCVTPEQIN